MLNPGNAKFPRCYRILKRADFLACKQNSRQRYTSANLILVLRRRDVGYQRLGVVVTRKMGGAVVRNRWRRIIREVFRMHRQSLPRSTDHVVIVKQGVKGQPASGLHAELRQLFLRVAK